MMIDVLFVDEWVILVATAPMHSVTAVINLGTLHKTAPTRFLLKNTMPPRWISFKTLKYPYPKGQITLHLLWSQIWEILTDHNPATIPKMRGTAVSEGTYPAPHPVTAAVHATLQLMDAPITICAMACLSSIVTPLPTLTTSPTDFTHTTILDQSQSCSSNSHHTAQETQSRKAKP